MILATGLGGNVQRQRFTLLMISTALISGSVAFAGGIGFVGLMAPHIARRLVGSSFGVIVAGFSFDWRYISNGRRFNGAYLIFTT